MTDSDERDSPCEASRQRGEENHTESFSNRVANSKQYRQLSHQLNYLVVLLCQQPVEPEEKRNNSRINFGQTKRRISWITFKSMYFISSIAGVDWREDLRFQSFFAKDDVFFPKGWWQKYILCGTLDQQANPNSKRTFSQPFKENIYQWCG